MKFKKLLPTAVCFFLTLIITFLVVFLPQFYYSLSDNSNNSGSVIESFSVGTVNRKVTNEEYVKLIESGETLWIVKKPEINNQELSNTVIGCLTELSQKLNTSERLASYMNQAIEVVSKSFPNNVDYYNVRGVLGDTTADANLMYLDYTYYASEDYNNVQSLSILINTDSNTIYEMSYDFYSEKDKLIEENTDGSTYEADKAELESVLKSYWDIDGVVNVGVYDYTMYFNIYTDSFSFYCDNPIITG